MKHKYAKEAQTYFSWGLWATIGALTAIQIYGMLQDLAAWTIKLWHMWHG